MWHMLYNPQTWEDIPHEAEEGRILDGVRIHLLPEFERKVREQWRWLAGTPWGHLTLQGFPHEEIGQLRMVNTETKRCWWVTVQLVWIPAPGRTEEQGAWMHGDEGSAFLGFWDGRKWVLLWEWVEGESTPTAKIQVGRTTIDVLEGQAHIVTPTGATAVSQIETVILERDGQVVASVQSGNAEIHAETTKSYVIRDSDEFYSGGRTLTIYV